MNSPYIAILANGELPTHSIPSQLIAQADKLVCCDGAANRWMAQDGRVPDVFIGDGDSIESVLREQYKERFIEIKDQETNDLTKAVDYAHTQFPDTPIYIFGATGRREDHTLGNIFLMEHYYKTYGIAVTLYTNHGCMSIHKNYAQLDAQAGQQFSIFALDAHKFSSTGLRYPLYDFSSIWQGTLNEAIQTSVTIDAQGVFLVYQVYLGMESK